MTLKPWREVIVPHEDVLQGSFQEEDWSTLPRFQRTRGVLRLMALVIHTLWREDNRDYLRRGEQPRQHKNRLIFLAPDRDALATLKDHTRRYLAWASIVHDAEQLNLDVHHAKEAKNSKAEAEERLKGSLREVYRWVLVPMQEAKSRGGLTELFWEEVTIAASASNMSEAIKRVLVENELVIEAWAPIHLANTLRQWFWKEDRSEVNALFVWQAMCNYT